MKKNNVFIWMFLGLIFVFMSCTKIEDIPSDDNSPVVKENLLVEEYSYDSNGIVFKITNDIEHAWNYRDNVLQKIDSVCVMKFHCYPNYNYTTLTLKNGNCFTWFSKKGQYVCWRYKYIHEGSKYLCVGFPNIQKQGKSRDFIIYLSNIPCDATYSTYPHFQNLFPIVNDTVQMKLSDIRPDMFKRYK